MNSKTDHELKYFDKYIETQIEVMKSIGNSIESINRTMSEIKALLEVDRKTIRTFHKWIIGALLAAVLVLAGAKMIS